LLVCSKCAQDNPASASTCSRCGTRLTAADFAKGVTRSGSASFPEEGTSRSADPPTSDKGPRDPSHHRANTTAGSAESRPKGVQEPFASNPFRVLRLPAGASGDQIRQTIEQVRIEARLGSDPEVESRLDVLTKAQAELLDPSKRIQHEVLWFYDPPGCLYEGDLEETNQALARYRAGSESEEDRRSAHDLALWLLVEAVHSSNPEITEDWTVRALSAWSDLAHEPVYLRHLPGSEKSRKHVAETVWGLGVDVLAISSRRCMNNGDLDGVLSRYRGAKSYGLEESDLIKVVEPAIEIAVLEGQRKVAEARVDSEAVASDPARARSWAKGLEDDLSDQVDLSDELPDLATRELDKVLDEAADMIRSVSVSLHNDLSETQLASYLVEVGLELAVSRKTVEQLESDLGTLRGLVAVGPLAGVINSAVSAIQDGDDAQELFEAGETLYESLVDYEGDEESAEAALRSALPVLRAVSIRLHNEYGETTDAATVMGWCMELAEDEEVRERFEKDQRQLSYQMHLANCFSLVASKRWTEAEGAARAAYSYADSVDDRRTANDTITAIVNKRNARVWKPIAGVAVAAVVVGLIVWGAIAGSDDESSGPSNRPVSVPTFSVPSNPGGTSGSSGSGSVAECLDMLDELNASEEELNSIEDQIEGIEAAYPGQYLPPDVYDRYNGLIDSYNRLRIPYNNLVSEYNRECAR
jgi:hypothetical protein